jgi:hypothetical protein
MADPLRCEFPLPLQKRYYPLGFPLDLFSNSELIVAAADASWAEWKQAFDRPPAVLRIGVEPGSQPRSPLAPLYRGYRNLLSMHGGPEEFAVCDLAQAFGFAWLTDEIARDAAYVRYFYVEAMGYILLNAAHLAPVHAACVTSGNIGMLLCGDSGAGKSSLAYACARAGWTFVCDDASFLVRDIDAPVVTGNAHLIRLRSSAPALFPEFTGLPVTGRPDGKPTIEIETRKLRSITKACQAKISRVLFLERGTSGNPSLSPFPKEEAFHRWIAMLHYGDDQTRSAQKIALERLLAAEMFEFRYSNLTEAVAFLDATFRSGATSRSTEVHAG